MQLIRATSLPSLPLSTLVRLSMTDGDRKSILTIAAASSQLLTVDYLFSCNIDSNDNPLGRPSPFHRAAYGGHTDIYLLLLSTAH